MNKIKSLISKVGEPYLTFLKTIILLLVFSKGMKYSLDLLSSYSDILVIIGFILFCSLLLLLVLTVKYLYKNYILKEQKDNEKDN
jgi:protein-S-isoprenylcysteine O-methyltransferase Ste14